MVSSGELSELFSRGDSGPNSAVEPEFFIVGAPKCATTSMYHYLRKHPEIFLPIPKEPMHYGSDLDSYKFRTTRREYRSFFKGAEEFEISGEASPWYLYSETAAEEIHARKPDADIIIMLRDPVEAMSSLHGQFLYTGNEDRESFRVALELEAERKQGNCLPPGTYFRQGLFYRKVYRYYEQVRRYIEVFGRDQIHVILLKDLKQKPSSVFASTLEFLGVDEQYKPQFKQYNARSRFKSELLEKIIQTVSGETKKRLKEIVPVKTCAMAWRQLEPLLVENRENRSLPPSLREELNREFQDDRDRLQQLLNLDLSHWLGGETEGTPFSGIDSCVKSILHSNRKSNHQNQS